MRPYWCRRLGYGSLITLIMLVPVVNIVLHTPWTRHPVPQQPVLHHPQQSHPPALTAKMPTSLSDLPRGLIKSFSYTLEPLLLPHFVDDRDENIFKNTKANLDVMKIFSKQIELTGNVTVLKDVIIDQDSTCYWKTTDNYRLNSLGHAQSKTVRSVPSACPIMVKDPNSVHTFLSEILPRIIQVLPLLDQFKNTPIMLKWTTNPLILEILSSLRVPYIFHHSRPVKVNSMLDTCQTPADVSSLWHRGRHMLSIGSHNKGAPQSGQIIVLTDSSSGQLSPRLLNLPNLLMYLRKRYATDKVVELDTSVLSFDTYRETFSNARLMIGTLSDSLNAVYFCHQGAKVLEVVPIHPKGGAVVAGSLVHAQSRYWLMSNMLQLSHWRMYETAHSASGDITLSLARLRRVLDRMDIV